MRGLCFSGDLRNLWAELRSPHRIVRRGDRVTGIGQLGRSGVQIVDIHEITNVRVVACSDVTLVISALWKGNKGKHDGCECVS